MNYKPRLATNGHQKRYASYDYDKDSGESSENSNCSRSNTLEENLNGQTMSSFSNRRPASYSQFYNSQRHDRDAWNQTEITLLVAFVGFFANQVNTANSSVIRLSEIPWHKVSRNMVSRPLNEWRTRYSKVSPKTSLQCEVKWRKLFSNFELYRTFDGVLLRTKIRPPQERYRQKDFGLTREEYIKRVLTSANGTRKRQNKSNSKVDYYQYCNVLGKRKNGDYKETLLRFKPLSVLERRKLNLLYYRYGDAWNKIARELNISAEEARYHLQQV